MKSRMARNLNKMKKEQEENPIQKPLTAEQVLVKLVIDSQNNINRLSVMQEQQMVYINTLFKQVISNDQSANTNTTQTGGAAESNDNSTTAVSTQQGTIEHSKPSDNQSVTEENKTL